VFPRFATSKAEMVAAGVIPIDRLTDIRAPVDVVAARCGQPQLEAVYGIHLGPRSRDPAAAAAAAEAEDTAATSSSSSTGAAAAGPSSTQPGAVASSSSSAAAAAAGDSSQLSVGMRLLVSLARARGWAASGGLPDEVRAGRQILKDYTNGKLLYCKLPTGQQQTGFAPLVAPLPGTVNGMQLQQQPVKQPQQQVVDDTAAQQQQQQQASGGQQQLSQQQQEAGGSSTAVSAAAGLDAAAEPSAAEDDVDAAASTLLLSEADLELMEGLGIGPQGKPRRPDHKFHKKAARTKGTRGLQADAGGYDGAALSTGKKGGLVRVGGY